MFTIQITQEHKTKIEEIIKNMECPKDFQCYKSEFKDLCQIQIFRDGELIECLDKGFNTCRHSFVFGRGYFCKCLLRKYIAENFNI